jgi:hypothetical protein
MLELFSGLLSYCYYYQVEPDLERNLKPVLLSEYGVDKQVSEAVDTMQREVSQQRKINQVAKCKYKMLLTYSM